MKTRIGFLFLLAAVFLVQVRLWAQSQNTLLATTDLDCTWKLDGKVQGNLKADDSVVVPISLGKHLVQATSTDGLEKWKAIVTVKQAGQELVEIKLKEASQRREADAQPATEPKAEPKTQQTARPKTQATDAPTWTDAATGLMWAGKDNGSNLSWAEADDYCSNLKLAGYSKWRLPSIDELSGIYDESEDVNDWHIKGGIRISGWEWTNSAPTTSGDHRLFTFHGAKKDSILVVVNRRALCVRRSAD